MLASFSPCPHRRREISSFVVDVLHAWQLMFGTERACVERGLIDNMAGCQEHTQRTPHTYVCTVINASWCCVVLTTRPVLVLCWYTSQKHCHVSGWYKQLLPSQQPEKGQWVCPHICACLVEPGYCVHVNMCVASTIDRVPHIVVRRMLCLLCYKGGNTRDLSPVKLQVLGFP